MNSFNCIDILKSGRKEYRFFNLQKAAEKAAVSLDRIPLSIRVLIESALRNEDGRRVTQTHLKDLLSYDVLKRSEIPFVPSRVLLQDFTGVPCVVDLAAMRSAMKKMGGDPAYINPQLPVDLVIDHSVQVDVFNTPNALEENARIEFERNRERYEFLRWGQSALRQFRVIPPASGICHQVNLEYLGSVVGTKKTDNMVFFDSVIGTDSHTTMINGLGVLGWGVGGIEAEAAMLGQPLYMLLPSVIGVHLTGSLPTGITATDLVLRITQMLRAHGVVGKFVEFFGQGVPQLSVPDRATISNMAPEYGATTGYFPIDEQTLEYLSLTGRSPEQIDLIASYAQVQGVFGASRIPQPDFETVLTLDLSTITPSIAGPRRPQDRISLDKVKPQWHTSLTQPVEKGGFGLTAKNVSDTSSVTFPDGKTHELQHGNIVIAAITSCTNTSNPALLITAGILARNAVKKGLNRKSWVKTSFAPGSVVVIDYISRVDLMQYFEQLGFYLVGYGCTTCIGNSGPLPDYMIKGIENSNLVLASVLSGNRNFEGRIHPDTKANFLMSPPLVVAYALVGSMDFDFEKDALGKEKDGNLVYLRDIWPAKEEVAELVQQAVRSEDFTHRYRTIETSNEQWNQIPVRGGQLYEWNEESTYIQNPPFFDNMEEEPSIVPINNARVLVYAGESITTDHISPAGAISASSPAGMYLKSQGVQKEDFNSYGSRRGNDRIMTRGTFANIRFRNKLLPHTEGSATIHFPLKEEMSIYDAAQKYRAEHIPTIILAGKDYGMGSSRDWAAKGTYLLGVRAVIAESFERIHRSNLVGMGVLPLEFKDGQSTASLGLTGVEIFSLPLDDTLTPLQTITVQGEREDRSTFSFDVRCRIDSLVEVDYYRNRGILQFILRSFIAEIAS